MVAIAGAGGGENGGNGVPRDDVTPGAGRFARRGEQADDSYCSTSARPFEMT